MRRSPAACCLLALVAACAAEPPPAPRERVENPGLGIAIAALPVGFTIVANEGTTLELRGVSSKGPGTLTFAAGPAETNINLVEEIARQKEAFLAQPSGEYFGQRELVTPNGTAFTVRGRYAAPEGATEEVKVLAIHPWGDRKLFLTYRYPAGGDTQERADQLLEVIGEIEGVGTGS